MTVRKRSKQSDGGKKSKDQPKKASKSSKPQPKLKKEPWTFSGWLNSFFDDVDNLTLVIFRVMWGLIMAYECYTFIRNDYNKLNMYYVYPIFAPKYYGFFWVNAWPGDGMYYHIWTMLVAALGIATGFMFHLSAIVFFFGFTYLILLDACLYLNHFYLIAVMAFMLIFLPANKRLAVDSHLFPSIYSNRMPRWIIYLLRFTQTLVYFYAGIAKVNEDWFRGEPIRHWISGRAQRGYDPNSTLSYYVTRFLLSEGGTFFIAIGGLIFDLTAGFLLLFPRGIIFYFTLFNCIFFHLMNKFLMNIGIFPWVMLASTTLYFEPDWFFNIPGMDKLIERVPVIKFRGNKFSLKQKLVFALLIVFALHQIITPLRHHFYYDDVAWNEMGHRYSWRMKLRDKNCDVNIEIVDPTTNARYAIDYNSYVVGKQGRKIKPRPELMIQFGHFVADMFEEQRKVRPEVYIDLVCDLNYRGKQRMFREGVDIAKVDPYDWDRFPEIIYPLNPLTEAQQKQSILNWDKFISVITDPLQPAVIL